MDRWLGTYLEAFAECGRGDSQASSLLAFYGVPLMVTTDDAAVALTTDEEVLALVQRQAEGMRAADYHHSDVLDLQTTRLNATSTLCRGTFSRRRRDGSEIGRLTVTYLVTGASDPRRISALAVHSTSVQQE